MIDAFFFIDSFKGLRVVFQQRSSINYGFRVNLDCTIVKLVHEEALFNLPRLFHAAPNIALFYVVNWKILKIAASGLEKFVDSIVRRSKFLEALSPQHSTWDYFSFCLGFRRKQFLLPFTRFYYFKCYEWIFVAIVVVIVW